MTTRYSSGMLHNPGLNLDLLNIIHGVKSYPNVMLVRDNGPILRLQVRLVVDMQNGMDSSYDILEKQDPVRNDL